MRLVKQTCAILWNDLGEVYRKYFMPILGIVLMTTIDIAVLAALIRSLDSYTSLSNDALGSVAFIIILCLIALNGWIYFASSRAKALIKEENEKLIASIKEPQIVSRRRRL